MEDDEEKEGDLREEVANPELKAREEVNPEAQGEQQGRGDGMSTGEVLQSQLLLGEVELEEKQHERESKCRVKVSGIPECKFVLSISQGSLELVNKLKESGKSNE